MGDRDSDSDSEKKRESGQRRKKKYIYVYMYICIYVCMYKDADPEIKMRLSVINTRPGLDVFHIFESVCALREIYLKTRINKLFKLKRIRIISDYLIIYSSLNYYFFIFLLLFNIMSPIFTFIAQERKLKRKGGRVEKEKKMSWKKTKDRTCPAMGHHHLHYSHRASFG